MRKTSRIKNWKGKTKKCLTRLKQSDSRSEYAEMNISKLHHRWLWWCIFQTNHHSTSGLTSWRTRSSGRSWRSMPSPASSTTPSMRCSTNTKILKLEHSFNIHTCISQDFELTKVLMSEAWINNKTSLYLQLFESNMNSYSLEFV